MRSGWNGHRISTVDVQTADATLLDTVVQPQHDVSLRLGHLRHLRLRNDNVDEVVLVQIHVDEHRRHFRGQTRVYAGRRRKGALIRQIWCREGSACFSKRRKSCITPLFPIGFPGSYTSRDRTVQVEDLELGEDEVGLRVASLAVPQGVHMQLVQQVEDLVSAQSVPRQVQRLQRDRTVVHERTDESDESLVPNPAVYGSLANGKRTR